MIKRESRYRQVRHRLATYVIDEWAGLVGFNDANACCSRLTRKYDYQPNV